MLSACIVTPTWAGDLHHFRMLRRSLEAFGNGDTPHVVIVHTEDRPLYRQFERGGVILMTTAEVLPEAVERGRLACARYNGADGSWRAKLFRSLRKRWGWFPWATYFGWQVQQISKLLIPLKARFDVCVNLDSDLILCRRLDLAEFVSDGRPQLLDNRLFPAEFPHRHPGLWTETAHRLLGMPHDPMAAQNVRTDTPVVFDRSVIRELHEEVERRHGAPLYDVLLALKPVSWSEFVLYNVFAERFVGTRLQRRLTRDTLLEQCIDTPEERADAARLIGRAFESPHIRFLRIVSQTRDRARWTGEEFESQVLSRLDAAVAGHVPKL